MATQPTVLQQLVSAAKALLEAREDQMVTCEEWDALANAVKAAEAAQAECGKDDERSVRLA
jgi:hypothetical protein